MVLHVLTYNLTRGANGGIWQDPDQGCNNTRERRAHNCRVELFRSDR